MDDPLSADTTDVPPEARFGAELRRLRVRAGMSVRRLASELHRAHSSIVEYETGQRLAPVDVVEQYEQLFGLARGTLGVRRERARVERLEDPRDATTAERLGNERCPYMGLRAFGHADAALFFGREAQVEDVLGRLRETRFMAVIGASGSGKSSFVQAGLLPRLATPASGGAGAGIALMTPGAHPLWALTDAVTHAVGGAARVKPNQLRGDPRTLERAARHAATSGLVIAVDQLEELFTHTCDESERRDFIQALIGAWRDGASPVVVIVALRSDFYGRVPAYPPLSAAVVGNQALLGPMSSVDLRRAIELPAACAGASLQSGLTDTILEDLGDEPGALPLLSHALLETWGRRRRTMLTVAGYREAGAVRGAIAQTAERTLQSLSEGDRLLARRILLSLTDVGEGVEPSRRRVSRGDLVAGSDPPERLDAVIDILAQARLISVDHDTVVVAHEALIRHWPRLRAWIEADRVALLTHRRLIAAASEWQVLGREPGALHRGARLAAALEWAKEHGNELAGLEREFLAASELAERREVEDARRRTRRARALAASLGLLTLIVAAISVVALEQRDEARAQAAQATSLALVSAASPLLDSRPDVSLVLAFEAFKASPRVEARNAVRSALSAAREPGIVAILPGHGGAVMSVAFNPDRRILASAGSDNAVRLWDVRARTPLGRALAGHTAPVLSLAFSASGRVLASGGADNTVRLWDVHARRMLGEPLRGHDAAVTSVAFSPDGRSVASAANDSTIRLWDVRARKAVGAPLAGHEGAVTGVAFSRDGHTLASSSVDRTLRLWDVRTGRPLTTPLTGHRDWVTSVAFAPDGRTVASASNDHTIRLWDVSRGRARGTPLTTHRAAVTSLAFSADGRMLVSASADKTVRLWDARSGTPLGAPLHGHTRAVSAVAFSSDGHTLASAGFDKTVRLWDARARAGPGTRGSGHTGPIQSVAFGRHGHTVASGSDDGTILLWDVRDRRAAGSPLVGHTDSVESVAFSRDGRLLASAGFDGTVRLWDLRRRKQVGSALVGHTAPVSSVAFSPGGRIVASGGYDKTLRLWDVREHRQLGRPLIGHTAAVSSVAFSPNGRMLASAGFDKAVRLWAVRQRRQLGPPLIGHAAPVTSVAFAGDGRTVASGSSDGTVRIWDAERHRSVTALSGHTDGVTSVTFDQAGRTLASGSNDKTVRLWDVDARRLLRTPLTGHDARVASVAFSRDGREIASGGSDGSIRLWPTTVRSHARTLPSARIDGALRLKPPLFWRDIAELERLVCNIVGSGLTEAEWTRYAFGIPYRQSCR